MESFWIPPDLSLTGVGVLVSLSFLTSLISTGFGLGGGAVLLAVMPIYFSPTVLIPVHGMVQIGSNLGRLWVLWSHVHWPVLVPFTLGSVLGVGMGGLLVVELPPAVLELILGSFILFVAYGQMPTLRTGGMALGGAVSSFFTMFVGATGPFVATWLRGLALKRFPHVGTFGACMSLQHGLKILVFGLLGFNYGPYLGFILAMIASGFMGTLVGRLLLRKLSEQNFSQILRWILSLLALRLLWSAMQGLWGMAITP